MSISFRRAGYALAIALIAGSAPALWAQLYGGAGAAVGPEAPGRGGMAPGMVAPAPGPMSAEDVTRNLDFHRGGTISRSDLVRLIHGIPNWQPVTQPAAGLPADIAAVAVSGGIDSQDQSLAAVARAQGRGDGPHRIIDGILRQQLAAGGALADLSGRVILAPLRGPGAGAMGMPAPLGVGGPPLSDTAMSAGAFGRGIYVLGNSEENVQQNTRELLDRLNQWWSKNRPAYLEKQLAALRDERAAAGPKQQEVQKKKAEAEKVLGGLFAEGENNQGRLDSLKSEIVLLDVEAAGLEAKIQTADKFLASLGKEAGAQRGAAEATLVSARIDLAGVQAKEGRLRAIIAAVTERDSDEEMSRFWQGRMALLDGTIAGLEASMKEAPGLFFPQRMMVDVIMIVAVPEAPAAPGAMGGPPGGAIRPVRTR